jgi:anti-sigma-K factor RskA
MNGRDYISSGIVEQYVLGLCSSTEREEIDALRKTDVVLNDAIIQFEIQFEHEMLRQTARPNLETDNKIIELISNLGSAPVRQISQTSNNNKKFKWYRSIAAAAILLLGASIFINYLLYSKNAKQQQEIAALSKPIAMPVTLPVSDFKILQDPTITPIAMYGVGYHSICRCTMFWDKKTGKVHIMIHHLPKSSEKQDYQLWANVNGKYVSVGIVNDGIRDRFIEMDNMPAGASSFIVTLENAGGSATPNEDIYLQGSI